MSMTRLLLLAIPFIGPLIRKLAPAAPPPIHGTIKMVPGPESPFTTMRVSHSVMSQRIEHDVARLPRST